MKDLVLNFSLEKLLSLPPSEFLAVVVLVVLALLVLSPFLYFVLILIGALASTDPAVRADGHSPSEEAEQQH